MFLAKAVFIAITLMGCSLSLASIWMDTCPQPPSCIALQRPMSVSLYRPNESPAFVTPTADVDGWLAGILEAPEMFDRLIQDRPGWLPGSFELRPTWKEHRTDVFMRQRGNEQQGNTLKNNGFFNTLAIRSALHVEPNASATSQANNARPDSTQHGSTILLMPQPEVLVCLMFGSVVLWPRSRA